MSILQAPVIQPLPSTRKGSDPRTMVRFAYDFSTDVASPQVLGTYKFTGSIYELDVSAIRGVPAQTPVFKTLQFSQTFDTIAGDVCDGQLVIYVESTGQLIQLGTNQSVTASSITGTVMTGVVPIVSSQPTKIQFGKEVNSVNGLLKGALRATLFDFDLSPYISVGSSNGL